MIHQQTITIVTPSFNQGKYIEETIKSVISQEGGFFIDYIIMDGGSTDNTIEILKKYDELIKKGLWKIKCLGIDFRWASGKDEGQTHAINKGFQMAKGEIVSWINSDDMYCEKAFSVVADHFLNNPEVDFLFGDGDVINEYGNLQWEWLSRPYDFKILRSYHFLWNDFTNYIMQQATFWRINIFSKIGFLDESLHYAMDIEYWLRIGSAGFKIKHIPVKLGKFRMIEGTKSLSSPTVFWPESLEIFRRYNGAMAMEPFFRYYFYNEGLNNEFNPEIMEQKREFLFRKWINFENKEQLTLRSKSQKGFDRACLMLSYEAFLKRNFEKANQLYKKIIIVKPWLILHYRSLYFLISKFLGIDWSTELKKGLQWIIHKYRMKKYLYRYRRKENEESQKLC